MAITKRRDSIGPLTLARIERQAWLLRGEIGAAQTGLTPFKAHYDALSELQDAIAEVLNVLNNRPREWRDLRR